MANSARTIVVGVFRSESDAQAVEQDLVQSGIPNSDVRVGSQTNWTSGAASGGSALTGQPEHHGGFMGWLESLFGSDEKDRYAGTVERGNCVVTVHTDETNQDRVVEVMENHDAVDVDTESGSDTDRVADYDRQRNVDQIDNRADARFNRDARPTQGTGLNQQNDARSVPVAREELEIGKKMVQRGGVRIYTHTVEQPVEEQIRLREEKVDVQRRPVNRDATEAEANALRDQTIEVTEMAEVPVVGKRVRVVEEVVIGKRSDERTESVKDTVRRQEVKVEPMTGQTAGSSQLGGGLDDDFRRDYQTRYKDSGGSFDEYSPAYNYGYTCAGDSRYAGRRFEDVEDQLRTDYLRSNPNSAWDRIKGAVRYGWERVTGKRQS